MKNTKKPVPFFDILLTSLTILLIGASAYLFFLYNSNSSAQSPDKDLANVSSTIDETDSNFAGIKIITEIANDANTPFAIQYPQSNHTAFNDKIKKHIKGLQYDYLTNVEDYKQDHKDFTSELNISFETFQHPNGLYSFVFEKNESIDEESHATTQTFHLDPETGDMPLFEDLLENHEEQLTAFADIAAKHLKQNNANENTLSGEDITQLTEPYLENFAQFAFTDKALVLYFTLFEMDAPIPTIEIPYKEINDLLAAEFKISEDGLNAIENAAKKDKDGNKTNKKQQETTEDTNDKEVSNQKRVALTFDDGPAPNVTTRVLEILEKYDAIATFFMLGSRVEYYPEIAKQVQEAGHELGNHSWTHPDLSNATDEKVFEEIAKTSRIIEEVTGEKPLSFRPPYGVFNSTVEELAELPIALWDVDTLDWKHRNGDALLSYVENNVQDGSIILMHDIHASTADGLEAVMQYLVDNDFTFVTVSEVLE